MEWKPYYARELERPEARETLEGMLRTSTSDDALAALLSRRAVLSFPHTAIGESGAIQVRLAAALIRAGVRRIIALGVLHSGRVEAFQCALDDTVPVLARERAFDEVSGGWLPRESCADTPFGTLPFEACAETDDLRRDSGALLTAEFSLDTFFAVLRLAADVFACDPIAVLPVYVGMTRHPRTKGFESAQALAAQIGELWDSKTAVVATGDVVHYGAVYGSSAIRTNNLRKHFLGLLGETLDDALRAGDWALAYRLAASVLRSDQREMLPVLGELLGGAMQQEIVEFSLSNYAPILECPDPCVVASALIAYLDLHEENGR